MALIPKYVANVSLPGQLGQPRANVGMFDNVASAVSGLGGTITKVADDMEERKARADIEVAKTAMRERSLERSLQDKENRQGQAALDSDEAPGVYKKYGEDSDKWIGELTTNISPRFKDAANRELRGIQEGYKRHSATYQAQQLGIYRDAAVKESLNSTKVQTVALMEEPGSGITDIDEAAEEVRISIEANSGGRNVSEQVRAAQADLFSASLISKGDTDPAGAIEMLDAGKDDYLGDDPGAVEAIRNTLDEKRVEIGVKSATAVISNSFNLDTQFGEAQKAAAEIADDDIRKGTQSELSYLKARKEDVRRDIQRTEAENAYKEINKGNPPSMLEIDSNPRYDSGTKETVKRWSKAALSGETLVTNRDMYNRLNVMIAEDAAGFKSLDITDPKISSQLDQGDYEKFSDMQRNMKAGKTGGKPAAITHAMTLMKPSFGVAGIEVGAKAKGSDLAASQVVMEEVARWAGDFFDENGRNATDEEILKKGNKIFRDIKSSKPKSFFGFSYQSDFEGKAFDVKYGDIPDNDVADIKRSLEKRGVAATEDAIRNWYVRYLISQE